MIVAYTAIQRFVGLSKNTFLLASRALCGVSIIKNQEKNPIRCYRPSGANILPHQSRLLMLKDVAVIHEGMLARCRLIEGHEKLRLILDKYRVLPASQMSWRRCSFDRQDAKQRAVDVERMRHSNRDDFPDLGRSQPCFDIDAP